ncbi:hypothetical protein HYALB_00009369 [Hymenoscyphus albidus]|uniref:Uncharacterized protein n=1 Tax=Hymenoscyphus albidus TaxID=595503 RepID=A0A9N9LTI2_9HELO|nr:hypothetical protein HYALB_00009369 [Hymenoscyphus albidus]
MLLSSHDFNHFLARHFTCAFDTAILVFDMDNYSEGVDRATDSHLRDHVLQDQDPGRASLGVNFNESFPAVKWIKIPSSAMSRQVLAELGYSFEHNVRLLLPLLTNNLTRSAQEFILFQKIHEIGVQDSRESERVTIEGKDRYGEEGGRRRRVEIDRGVERETESAKERSSSTISSSSQSLCGDASRDSDDSDYMPQDFSFKLSRYRKGLQTREGIRSPAVGKGMPKKEPLTSSQQSMNVAHLGKVIHVWKSHYTGDGSIDGDQSVELKVAEGINSQDQPLFKSLQIEDTNMNFDRFETAVKGLPGLTDLQKSGLNRLFKLFGEIDRPTHTSNGSSVRFMTPTILSTTIRPEPRDLNESSRRKRSVIWMCLPYFLLQNYSANSNDLLPASHPAKTLLEAQSSFAHEKRDMQQAVCKLPGCPQGHCFHIAQVWCVVVDESFLVTGSHTSISTLFGKYVSLSTELPPPDMGRNQIQPRSFACYPAQIQVSSGEMLWSFPVNECESWYKFLLRFWEFSPKKLQFFYAGDIIQSKSWPKIIQQASKTSIRLSMTGAKSKSRESGTGLIYS